MLHRRVRRPWPLVLALALVLSIAVTGVALAASQQSEAGKDRVTQFCQLYLEKLAKVLGVSQDALKSAMKKAGEESLDEAVSKGYITSEQAERMKQALAEGRWPGFGPGPRRGFGRGLVMEPLAAALGLTPQQLCDELRSGKTLEELASAKGLTLEELKERLLKEAKDDLKEAVEAGRLTQDQANAILERLEQLDLSKMPCPPAGPRGFGRNNVSQKQA